MKTFKGVISSDFRVVVPDQFIEGLRRDAKSEGAVFLAIADKQHPVNDDAFVAAVLKNGMRQHLRATTAELFLNSGLGGTVSPATIEIVEVPHGFEDGGVGVQVVKPERKFVGSLETDESNAVHLTQEELAAKLGPATKAAMAVTPAPGLDQIAFHQPVQHD